MNKQDYYHATRQVTLIGAVTNTLLAATQLIGGWLSHSHALIADGIHTLSDLISDGVVLFAAKEASKAPDADHPYGHGRIETLASVTLGVLLALVGIGIVTHSIERLMSDADAVTPSSIALIFAAIAIIAKESLFHYTRHVGRKIHSSLLQANAWHHRSDAISSLMVLIGLAVSQFGYPEFDAIAAIGVAMMILKLAYELIAKSANELIDAGLDPEELREIELSIKAIDGVVSLHQLRTRSLGNEIHADVHIQVSCDITVSEGHQVSRLVEHALHEINTSITDITIHIDPEDDSLPPLECVLPTRSEVIRLLNDAWQGIKLAEQIQRVQLHYLNNCIEIEICLPLSALQHADNELLRNKALEIATICQFSLYYQAESSENAQIFAITSE